MATSWTVLWDDQVVADSAIRSPVRLADRSHIWTFCHYLFS